MERPSIEYRRSIEGRRSIFISIYVKSSSSAAAYINRTKPAPTQLYYQPSKKSISAPSGWVDAASAATSVTFTPGISLIIVKISLKQQSDAGHLSSCNVRLFNKTTNSTMCDGSTAILSYNAWIGGEVKFLVYYGSQVTYSVMPQFINNYIYSSIYKIAIKVIRLNKTS